MQYFFIKNLDVRNFLLLRFNVKLPLVVFSKYYSITKSTINKLPKTFKNNFTFSRMTYSQHTASVLGYIREYLPEYYLMNSSL